MHINKTKFLWLVVGLGAMAVGLMFAGIFCFISMNFNTVGTIIFVSFIMAALVLMILAIIYYCIFIYRMWDAINDGTTRPKPGQAVGFLFIPYFNLGWIFIAISKFPYEYNRYITRHNLAVQPMKKGIHIALPIVDLAWILVAIIMGFTVMFQVMFDMMRQWGPNVRYYRGYHNWGYQNNYQPDWQHLLDTLLVFGIIYLLMMVTRFTLNYLFIDRSADAINALPELAKPPQPTASNPTQSA
jgi:uncharacterized membrane protein